MGDYTAFREYDILSRLHVLQCCFLILGVVGIWIIYPLKISPFIRFPLLALWLIICLIMQFDRCYALAEDSVQIWSWFHIDTREAEFDAKRHKMYFYREIPRGTLQKVSLHLAKLWGLLIVELDGCCPQGNMRTWQFILRNRKKVLLVFTERSKAEHYRNIIEGYINEKT